MVRLFRAVSTLGLVFLLAACGGTAATNTPPPANTAAPAAATTAPTNTVAPATPTTAPATPTTAPATPTTVPATPTTAASPTRAAASPTRAAAASPTRAGTPSAGAGNVLVDAENACQVTLPANFTADAAGGGNATSNDDNAFLNISSFPTEPLGFQETARLFVDGFTTQIDNYVEADRQEGTDRGRQFLGVTFTATLAGEPIVGQFYFVEEAGTSCALSVLVKESAASGYGDTIGALVDSVQAVKP